jgi:hypothetical protein
MTENIEFEIKNRKVRIEYVFKKPHYATHIELTFLINQKTYKKFFTKTRLQLGTIDSKINKVLIGCCTNGEKVTRSEKIIGAPKLNSLGNLNQVQTILEGIVLPDKKFLKKISSVWVEIETPKPYFLPKKLHIISLKLLFDERIKLD